MQSPIISVILSQVEGSCCGFWAHGFPPANILECYACKTYLERKGGWGGRNKCLFLYYLYFTTIRTVRHRKKDALRIYIYYFFLNLTVKDLVGGKEIRKQVDLYFFNPFLIVMQKLIWISQPEGVLKLFMAEGTTQRLLMNLRVCPWN